MLPLRVIDIFPLRMYYAKILFWFYFNTVLSIGTTNSRTNIFSFTLAYNYWLQPQRLFSVCSTNQSLFVQYTEALLLSAWRGIVAAQALILYTDVLWTSFYTSSRAFTKSLNSAVHGTTEKCYNMLSGTCASWTEHTTLFGLLFLHAEILRWRWLWTGFAAVWWSSWWDSASSDSMRW